MNNKPIQSKVTKNQGQTPKPNTQKPIMTPNSQTSPPISATMAPSSNYSIHPQIKPQPHPPGHQVPVGSKKNKPVPIAVLPKPSRNVKSTFNPNMNLHIKQAPSIKIKQDGMNINTSKKWVLPPRPRPGRKPVNSDDERDSMGDRENKIKSTHVTSPGSRLGSHPPQLSALEENQPTSHDRLEKMKPKLEKSKPEKYIKDKLAKEKGGKEKPKHKGHGRKNETTSPEIMNLKMNYLSKLKEQELINNYIDIINNQIKQLSFIKNGYMTLDTLNQINPSSDPRHADNSVNRNSNELPSSNKNGELHSESELFRNLNLNTPSDNSTPSGSSNGSGVASPNVNSSFSSPDPEGNNESKIRNFQDLESINNSQDLDRFLSYLLKSSNLIHRVTKSYKTDHDYSNINSQIAKYLELRGNYQKAHSYNKSQYKKTKYNNHPPQTGTGEKKIDTLLNENNLFDQLALNNFHSDMPDMNFGTISEVSDRQRVEETNSKGSNGTSTEVGELKSTLKCSICKKLTPCFCLDIDRKFMDSDY